MVRKMIIPLVLATLIISCKKDLIKTPIDTPPGSAATSVVTQHNDNTRAGLNNHEKTLTTANVNSKQFGKLFTVPVDDQVYAQPLVVGSLTIGTARHNVVFIATVNNTVYASDGDNGNIFWQKNFTASAMRPPNSGDMSFGFCIPYTDITNNIGIIGTPVIDSVSQTMYFVARSTNGTNFYQHLHAISLLTGGEQSGSPVVITASVPGTGDGNVGGIVS
jgi:hypothetical protein